MKKYKPKSEVIEQKFKEAGIGKDVYMMYQNENYQVIIVDLLGRVLWMNDLFQRVNIKGEDDLIESLYGQYGFEALEEGLDFLFSTYPKTHSHSTIDFVSFIKK